MEGDFYKKKNQNAWNIRTAYHVKSDFYDVPGFLKGQSSLDEITLELMGDVKGKSILHLQCHFGLDTLSLARMGAQMTGMDISDKAIDEARILAEKSNLDATFICCDIYDLPNVLDEKFDIIYTSYGVIGWLPDMKKWADIIARYLKPSGKLVFIEFHPVIWMLDDELAKIQYRYFKSGPIVETETGTYANTEAPIKYEVVSWNHGLGEVVNALIVSGIRVDSLVEYDYSPYDSFKHTIEVSPNRFRIQHHGDKLPMVYSVVGYLL